MAEFKQDGGVAKAVANMFNNFSPAIGQIRTARNAAAEQAEGVPESLKMNRLMPSDRAYLYVTEDTPDKSGGVGYRQGQMIDVQDMSNNQIDDLRSSVPARYVATNPINQYNEYVNNHPDQSLPKDFYEFQMNGSKDQWADYTTDKDVNTWYQHYGVNAGDKDSANDFFEYYGGENGVNNFNNAMPSDSPEALSNIVGNDMSTLYDFTKGYLNDAAIGQDEGGSYVEFDGKPSREAGQDEIDAAIYNYFTDYATNAPSGREKKADHERGQLVQAPSLDPSIDSYDMWSPQDIEFIAKELGMLQTDANGGNLPSHFVQPDFYPDAPKGEAYTPLSTKGSARPGAEPNWENFQTFIAQNLGDDIQVSSPYNISDDGTIQNVIPKAEDVGARLTEPSLNEWFSNATNGSMSTPEAARARDQVFGNPGAFKYYIPGYGAPEHNMAYFNYDPQTSKVPEGFHVEMYNDGYHTMPILKQDGYDPHEGYLQIPGTDMWYADPDYQASTKRRTN